MTDSTRAEIEERLRRSCYPAVFGDRAIDNSRDFFAAGADSIELMRLIAVVQEHFAVEIEVAEFIVTPTAAMLVDLVEREMHRAAA